MPVVLASAAADLGTALVFAEWARRQRVIVELRASRRRYVRQLFASGLIFFVSNIANMLRRSFPVLIIANALGPTDVPAFSVPLAMFTIGLSVSELIAGSLWPAYGEAVARGDWAWVSRAFRLGSDASLLAAGGIALLGAFCGADVMRIWVPRISVPSVALFAIFALWMWSQASSNAAASLLCGLNRNWLVMWSVILEGVATLGLGAWQVRASGSLGVVAVIAACGGLGALALNVYIVPRATDGNVRVDPMAYARVLACSTPAAAVGLLARAAVHSLPAWGRLVSTATPIGIVYALFAWTFGLSASARAQIRARISERMVRVRVP